MKRPKKTLLTVAVVAILSILTVYLYNARSNSPSGSSTPSILDAYLNNSRSTPPSESSTLSLRDAYYDRLGTKPPKSTEERTADLMAERANMNQTVWAQEVAAQEHEQTIVKYWDQMLKPEDDKYAVLAKIPFDSITLDTLGDTIELEWGIKKTVSGGPGRTLDQKAWRTFLRNMEKEGYAIDAIEFHQSSYEENPGGYPVSIFSTLLNLENKETLHRWNIKSNLRVEWTDKVDEEGLFIPGKLSLSDTKVLERQGPPVFEHKIIKSQLNEWSYLLVYDINRDGHSDILIPGDNLAMLNDGKGNFTSKKLFTALGIAPPSQRRIPVVSVIADFDSDGYADILFSGIYKNTPATDVAPSELGLFLFKGTDKGLFTTPGKKVISGPLDIPTAMCLTAGDIDADGDLDVWLAQYKNPYDSGQMPTPFYDANDGHPGYLLLNEGDGKFKDVTKSSGLGKKRFRRSFASSFVDLDDDQDLDLLVSSDFAGTDIHYNDGTGHFIDRTDDLLDESANFGMGHTLADFNQDGLLDFHVIGMGSTTMRRLNQMGLEREDFPEFLEERTKMGYGNRMYISRGKTGFSQPEFNDSISRSGWAWGATSLDFDNDGDSDVYIANGHQSGTTTKDYCTQFWCHDIYTGDSNPDISVFNLFKNTMLDSMRVKRYSWDGFQKNHLFMNQSGKGFENVAYLFNTALIDDSRNAVSDDFNSDGRPDLLVISRHLNEATQQIYDKLHLYTNQWPAQNNWIGVRLHIEPGSCSPIGTVIRVQSQSGEQLAHIVTGDSFRSQHANMKHFGIGSDSSVASVEIQWPDGTKQVLDNPEINTYHKMSSISSK